MKKATQFLVFALVLSANLAFSQSKISLAVGSKYYNFIPSPYSNSKLFGITAAAYYDLGKRNQIGAKIGFDINYMRISGTSLFAKNATLAWRFAFVKRAKFSIFIENGLGIRYFNAEKPRSVALTLSPISNSSNLPLTKPAFNTLNWDRIIGLNYHIDKNNIIGLQYENTLMKSMKYNIVLGLYSLNIIYEYHF